jgi:ribonucleoside-diphosphate reductase alpha chain
MIKITKLMETEDVFDITVADNHNFFANGILIHNCGEQPLPPYGACLLGSQNLVKFIKNGEFDFESFEESVRVSIRMMDNTIDVSNFPLEEQRQEALNKRRIGLGVTGLADALIMMKIKYGSDQAAFVTEDIMRSLSETAYRTSIALAKEKGAFPLLDKEKYLATPNIMNMPADIRSGIRQYGIRNALLTSIAPTGTISIYAGNVSSGIEPVFAYAYTRKVLQKDGSSLEEEVVDYAIDQFYKEHGKIPLPEYFVNAQTLAPAEHVKMQAAAQKYIDSAISKTINCPEDISLQDFQEIYMMAWDQGCKGCTTYRPNDVTGSVLTAKSDDSQGKDESQEACTWDPLTGSRSCAG